MRVRCSLLLGCFAASALALGGCSESGPVNPAPQPQSGPSSAAEPVDRELILSAAASTKELMESLVEKFQAKSGTEVKVNPGPSSGLASQIIAGAPADLFLSANQKWADEVEKGGKAQSQVRLLTNSLVIVVPEANPAGVKEPKDLLLPQVKKIALAGEKVPAGTYADQALTKLELLEPLVAAGKIVRGQDVRSALSFVERGEAEAGIVYSTDLAAAKGVKSVHEFDPSLHDEIVYVLVLLKAEEGNAAAKELFEFLQSAEADAAYAQFGFARLPQ
jgi:molybdate transport system substrate-binding protein